MFLVVSEGYYFSGLPEARCRVGLVPSLTTQRGFGHFHFVGRDMKQIPLTRGQVAIVDDEDFEELNKHKWFAAKSDNTFYANRAVGPHKGQTRLAMHRCILKASQGQFVDHVNHNGLDNRRKNIRICTPSQNQQNRKSRIDSISKFKGVSWDKEHEMWKVTIGIGKKKYRYCGHFKNEIEAAKTYDIEAKRAFGLFAYLNFDTEG